MINKLNWEKNILSLDTNLERLNSKKYPTKREKYVDKLEPTPITLEQYKQSLREERWLERANLAFREGIPDFHIPRSDVFYIKALLRDKLGYDLPVLMVEKLLIEEGLMTKGGVPIVKELKTSEGLTEPTA